MENHPVITSIAFKILLPGIIYDLVKAILRFLWSNRAAIVFCVYLETARILQTEEWMTIKERRPIWFGVALFFYRAVLLRPIRMLAEAWCLLKETARSYFPALSQPVVAFVPFS